LGKTDEHGDARHGCNACITSWGKIEAQGSLNHCGNGSIGSLGKTDVEGISKHRENACIYNWFSKHTFGGYEIISETHALQVVGKLEVQGGSNHREETCIASLEEMHALASSNHRGNACMTSLGETIFQGF
jgi:hypothetical protein